MAYDEWKTVAGEARIVKPRLECLPSSEEVAQRKHVHVQTWVRRGQASVGHVLKAIPGTPVPGEIQVEPDVAGELNTRAEVVLTKFVGAQECRAKPPGQGHWPLSPAHHQARPERPDCGVLIVSVQPARREVQPRLQMKLPAQIPAPRQIPIPEYLGLVEPMTAALGGETAPHPHRFQAKTLRPGRHGPDQQPGTHPARYTNPTKCSSWKNHGANPTTNHQAEQVSRTIPRHIGRRISPARPSPLERGCFRLPPQEFGDCLRPRPHLQLLVDAADVGVHRLVADAQ